jgi:hypothetical protein
VETFDPFFLACPGSALTLLANFEVPPAGMQSVSARYRWNGASSTAYNWNEIDLTPEGMSSGYDQYRLSLPDGGSEAEALFADQSGAFEYQIIATANDGSSSQWPPGDDVYVLPIDPCVGTRYIVEEYGVSDEEAGYGPGCTPSEVTFEIVLRGVSRVEDAWLEYYFLAPETDAQPVSAEVMVDLDGPVPSHDFPGAVVFSISIDLNAEATPVMNGQAGFLAWNMYVRTDDGMVFEYPQGGPPMVSLEACSN